MPASRRTSAAQAGGGRDNPPQSRRRRCHRAWRSSKVCPPPEAHPPSRRARACAEGLWRPRSKAASRHLVAFGPAPAASLSRATRETKGAPARSFIEWRRRISVRGEHQACRSCAASRGASRAACANPVRSEVCPCLTTPTVRSPGSTIAASSGNARYQRSPTGPSSPAIAAASL